MRLSFVIPAYNEERYIGPCLESIVRQVDELCAAGDLNRGEVEIIVVNNASTDGTGETARAYAGVRVVDEPRKGLTFARQAGFAASTGDLIANVDSDSRLTPGWLRQVLSTFAREPSMAALSGPLHYYDITPRERILVQVFYMIGFASYAMNRWVLRIGSMIQGGNFVVTRPALEKIGGFNTDISFYGEDTDVARRLNRVGRVRFTFRLRMFSSARRLKKEGMFRMAAKYSLNYFWTTFFKKPYTEAYIDIRD